ncbi:MAG TPA: DUF1707 domain-containing protein [Streptosporangiaceae bacterium]|jgi:hypothetical protein
MSEMEAAAAGDAPEPYGRVLRASHEDRDRVVEQLRLAAGDGRLTAEELDDRLEKALLARTVSELARLVTDLPVAAGQAAVAGQRKPRDLARIDCGSGSVRRNGRWLVPRQMDIKVTSGSVTLDFTDAVIGETTMRIDADVRSGSLKLLTRPGIAVDTDEVALRSGSTKVVAPWGPDVPVQLHVEVAGRVGSGSITARPRRRSLWQWLLRRPRPWELAIQRRG